MIIHIRYACLSVYMYSCVCMFDHFGAKCEGLTNCIGIHVRINGFITDIYCTCEDNFPVIIL